MKTLFRWLAGIFLFLSTALFILTLTAPMLLPPSEHKALITALVEGQSGRKLSIDGEIQLRITPALHLFCTLNKARISGNSAFGDTPFISSEKASLELSLWRILLQRHLHINSLQMDNVTVNLVRSKNNIGNWQQGAAPVSPQPKPQTEATADSANATDPAGPTPTPPAPSLRVEKLTPLLQTVLKVETITLGRLFLNGVNLRHENRLTGDIHLLNNLWIRVGGIKNNIPFPFEAGGNLSQENILGSSRSLRALDITAQGNGTLTQSPDPILLLEDLRIDGTLKATFLQKRGLRFSSSAIAEIRPKEQKMSLREFSVRQGDSVLEGKGFLENATEPHLNIALTIPQCAPHPLLKQLKNPPQLPAQTDVFKTFDAHVKIDARPGLTQISDLVLHLDDSTATGTMNLYPGNGNPSTASVHIDKLDADRYQRVLPSFPLRQLKIRPLQLDLDIDTLLSQGLEFNQAQLHLSGGDGIFEISPFTAAMQKGSVEINGTINLSGSTPKIELSKKISNLPLSSFLLESMHRDDISGTATLHTTISTRGKNKKELWRQMHGTLDFTLTGGAIKNAPIIKAVQQCWLPAETTPQDGLPFSKLTGSGNISNGRFSAQNLLAVTSNGSIKGTVELDLDSGFTSLSLDPGQSTTPVPEPAQQGGQEVIHHPLDITPPCQFSGNLDGSGSEIEHPQPAPATTAESPVPPEEVPPPETLTGQSAPEAPEEQLPPVEKVTGD